MNFTLDKSSGGGSGWFGGGSNAGSHKDTNSTPASSASMVLPGLWGPHLDLMDSPGGLVWRVFVCVYVCVYPCVWMCVMHAGVGVGEYV
jgi:hypothetical protein